jgi:double zinc ribbon protein
MPPLAYFGIESSGLSLLIDLLILFVVVLYLSLIYWTYADARRRILDPILVGCATAASLFPFVGTIVYVILRPPEYLEDVRERELETQAAEARLHELERGLCPYCDYRVEPDFVRCPSCLRKLKERCVNCSRPLDQAWTICPYCETEVPGVPASRRRRRRTAALESERSEAGSGAGEGGSSAADDERSGFGQPATRAGEEGPRTAPLAPPEPVVAPHSSAGRSRRPRPTP